MLLPVMKLGLMESHSPPASLLSLGVLHFIFITFLLRDTRLCSWLRHCGTIQKVVGPIPNGVFH